MKQDVEIRLKEELSQYWQHYFAGLELELRERSGQKFSVLKGELSQSELETVLSQIRDLNLHLLAVCNLTKPSHKHP